MQKREARRKAPVRVYMQKIEAACKRGDLGEAVRGRNIMENDLLYCRRPSADHTFYEKLKCVRCVNRAIKIIRKYFPGYVDLGMLGEKLQNHTYYE